MKLPQDDIDYKIKLALYEVLKITGGLLSGAMIALVIVALYLGFSVMLKIFA